MPSEYHDHFLHVEPVSETLAASRSLYSGKDRAGMLKAALDDYVDKGLILVTSVDIGDEPHLVFRVYRSGG